MKIKLSLRFLSLILFTGFLILFFACEKLDVKRKIKIETLSVTDITSGSASVSGEIIDLGEQGVIDHGHCWATIDSPTINQSKKSLGPINSRGVYISPMDDLVPFTKYYVRAYATDAQGTTYGNQIEFTKSVITDDRDGHAYKWVSIGDQVWMAENLAYIPAVCYISNGSRTDPCYYVFDYDGNDVAEAKARSNYTVYGVLYNWPAVMDGASGTENNPSGVQGVCPDGWHLPSDAEWKQLEMHLGMSAEVTNSEGFRGTDEGGKLKEAGYAHWYEPNEGADNSSGFTALPGGWREDSGDLLDLGGTGCWWSATDYDESSAWKRALVYSDATIDRYNYYKDCAFSVRCVRND